jgi:DNA topoisomerase-1
LKRLESSRCVPSAAVQAVGDGRAQDHIEEIRLDYNNDMKDKTMATRQRAVAVYLIDKFALRAGNEKGEEEADTVGCCSLKCNNITLTPPTEVLFDFLGKDSIRFLNTFNVDPNVFANLRIFKKNKEPDDMLFDRLSVRSAAVFRQV